MGIWGFCFGLVLKEWGIIAYFVCLGEDLREKGKLIWQERRRASGVMSLSKQDGMVPTGEEAWTRGSGTDSSPIADRRESGK